jgi:threonine 3-dehydrogenase
MKALVKREAREGLWLQEVPVPKIGINDVLIEVVKTSICGTDVHIYNWDAWAQKTIKVPMVIGHEFVGRIVELGSNVHDFQIGELVSAEGHAPSGIGVNRDGAFAEYISVPVTNLWACDPAIPADVLSCFDPLGNAAHTALSFNLVGEDVLITGAGPIGCMAAGIAQKVGARHVVVTDLNSYRLDLARKMGATLTLDVRQERLQDAQKKLGMKEGFDVGLEMSGNPQALRDMLANMAHGGKIALLGILPRTEIDWDFIIFNGLTLKGIYGREMYETWYKMTMLIQGGLDITPLITHRFPYTEFEQGFAAMRSGNSGKVVLTWKDA